MQTSSIALDQVNKAEILQVISSSCCTVLCCVTCWECACSLTLPFVELQAWRNLQNKGRDTAGHATEYSHHSIDFQVFCAQTDQIVAAALLLLHSGTGHPPAQIKHAFHSTITHAPLFCAAHPGFTTLAVVFKLEVPTKYVCDCTALTVSRYVSTMRELSAVWYCHKRDASVKSGWFTADIIADRTHVSRVKSPLLQNLFYSPQDSLI